MTDERYNALMKDDDLRLTDPELCAGWHFCYEWDGLLIGPGMDEVKMCGCLTGEADGKNEPTKQ